MISVDLAQKYTLSSASQYRVKRLKCLKGLENEAWRQTMHCFQSVKWLLFSGKEKNKTETANPKCSVYLFEVQF